MKIWIDIKNSHEPLFFKVLMSHMEDHKFSLLYYKAEKLIAIDSINSAADHMAGRRLLAEETSPDKSAVQDVSIKLKEFLV